jgi:hypothetical protein
MNALSTNLLLVYHMCDEILGGIFESNLSRIPPNRLTTRVPILLAYRVIIAGILKKGAIKRWQ